MVCQIRETLEREWTAVIFPDPVGPVNQGILEDIVIGICQYPGFGKIQPQVEDEVDGEDDESDDIGEFLHNLVIKLSSSSSYKVLIKPESNLEISIDKLYAFSEFSLDI